MDYRAELDTAISRFDQFARRSDDRQLGGWITQRTRKRGTAAVARRAATVALVLAMILAVTVVAGLVLDGIGLTGLFIAGAVMLLAILVLGLRPGPAARPVAPYKDEMPNKAVVQRLGTLLDRHRSQLPPAAGQRVEAIRRELPMLEAQLADVNPLDPLAQDARRLLGQHLPDLLDRYERVPPQYRRERDGDGLSVDERLVSSLDAARSAIGDLGRQLTRQEVDDFSTQGRFLESRYRDDPLSSGDAKT